MDGLLVGNLNQTQTRRLPKFILDVADSEPSYEFKKRKVRLIAGMKIASTVMMVKLK